MMLQINHSTLIHRRDLRTLVEDFSFTLHEGDKAAIIGEEGNGKSTLLSGFTIQNELTAIVSTVEA